MTKESCSTRVNRPALNRIREYSYASLQAQLKTLFFIALTLVVAGSTKLAISAAPSVPCQTPGNFRRIPSFSDATFDASGDTPVSSDYLIE